MIELTKLCHVLNVEEGFGRFLAGTLPGIENRDWSIVPPIGVMLLGAHQFLDCGGRRKYGEALWLCSRMSLDPLLQLAAKVVESHAQDVAQADAGVVLPARGGHVLIVIDDRWAAWTGNAARFDMQEKLELNVELDLQPITTQTLFLENCYLDLRRRCLQ